MLLWSCILFMCLNIGTAERSEERGMTERKKCGGRCCL